MQLALFFNIIIKGNVGTKKTTYFNGKKYGTFFDILTRKRKYESMHSNFES